MSETALHSSHPYHTTESAQNYLEAILMLSEQKPVVRSVDVANELGYKKSSISIAMKNLRENNLITVTPEGYIYLTDEGLKIASTIYERHKCCSCWLANLGVDQATAAADACKIEHDLSPESFAAIKRYITEQYAKEQKSAATDTDAK